MHCSTKRKAYQKHQYSGPRKSLKRVRAGIRQYYDTESRIEAWRFEESKKKQLNEENVIANRDMTQNKLLRTYERKRKLEERIADTSNTEIEMEETYQNSNPDIDNTNETVLDNTSESLSVVKDVFNKMMMERDEFSLFGDQVAVKLRKISSPYARVIVENKINILLMEGQLGLYDATVVDIDETEMGNTSTSSFEVFPKIENLNSDDESS